MNVKPNPNVTILFEPKEGAVESIRVLAPIREEGLRTTIVSKTEPEFFGALLQRRLAETRGWPFQPPEKLQSRFFEAGLLVNEQQLSRPVRFNCDLNDELSAFVPKRPKFVHPEKFSSGLILNPSLKFVADSVGGVLKYASESSLKLSMSFLQPDRYWYLVSWPEQYVPRLYSLNAEQHGLIQTAGPGEPVPPEISPSLAKLFFEAEISVAPDYLQKSAVRIQERLQECSEHLSSKRYTVLKSAFHPFQLAALRRYYRALIDEGYLRFGDENWPLRFFTPNDPIAHLYHQLAHPFFTAITGQSIEPTFLFFASYRPGAALPPHKDREQCEYSSSILLDFIPEPDDVSPWPLYVELLNPPATVVPIHLGIGDMLVYYGRELRHYRDPFKEGQASTTWLFFFQPVTKS